MSAEVLPTAPWFPPIRAGSRWQHFKGGTYEVMTVATDEASRVRVVVYRDTNDVSKVWTRSVQSWFEKVKVSQPGQLELWQPRFMELPPT